MPFLFCSPTFPHTCSFPKVFPNAARHIARSLAILRVEDLRALAQAYAMGYVFASTQHHDEYGLKVLICKLFWLSPLVAAWPRLPPPRQQDCKAPGRKQRGNCLEFSSSVTSQPSWPQLELHVFQGSVFGSLRPIRRPNSVEGVRCVLAMFHRAHWLWCRRPCHH